MTLQIRPFSPEKLEEVVQLSLAAWAPVFQSFEQVLGRDISALLYPDWQRAQGDVVKKYCTPLPLERLHLRKPVCYTLRDNCHIVY